MKLNLIKKDSDLSLTSFYDVLLALNLIMHHVLLLLCLPKYCHSFDYLFFELYHIHFIYVNKFNINKRNDVLLTPFLFEFNIVVIGLIYQIFQSQYYFLHR